jgi:hypothetical protein
MLAGGRRWQDGSQWLTGSIRPEHVSNDRPLSRDMRVEPVKHLLMKQRSIPAHAVLTGSLS